MSPTFSLLDNLASGASTNPDKRLYQFVSASPRTGWQTLTYGELQAKVTAVGQQLARLDEENIILMFPAGLEFIVAFLACLYAGKVAVPLPVPNARDKHNRISPILRDAATRTILTNRSVVQTLSSTNRLADVEASQLQVLAIEDLLTQEVVADSGYQRRQKRAFLQYTSGSTGVPKGVAVSRANLIANLTLLATNTAFYETSVMVTWLPMFHDMGLVAGILLPLYCGGSCYVMSPIEFMVSPHKWLSAITEYRGTHSVAPNFAFDLCVDKLTDEHVSQLDLSSLQYLGNCAEPVREVTLSRFREKFTVAGLPADVLKPGYGLAEATLMVTATHVDDSYRILHVKANALERDTIVIAAGHEGNAEATRSLMSCGRVPHGSQLRIVDPFTKHVCDADQVGEIWVRSDSVADGYHNNAELSRVTFEAYCTEPAEGPYLRTGDLGFLHDDLLYVTGRIKDVLKIRGKSIYPQDIEWTSQSVSPYLKIAAAVVLDDEKPVVSIVQEIAVAHLPVEQYEELAMNIARAVSGAHGVAVEQVVLIKKGTAPRTSSGKIRRNECRSRLVTNELLVVHQQFFGAGTIAAPSEATTNETDRDPLNLQATILHAVRTVSGIDSSATDILTQSIYSLGIDSLTAMKLLHRLEDQLRTEIPVEWLLSSQSIGEFCERMQKPPELVPNESVS